MRCVHIYIYIYMNKNLWIHTYVISCSKTLLDVLIFLYYTLKCLSDFKEKHSLKLRPWVKPDHKFTPIRASPTSLGKKKKPRMTQLRIAEERACAGIETENMNRASQTETRNHNRFLGREFLWCFFNIAWLIALLLGKCFFKKKCLPLVVLLKFTAGKSYFLQSATSALAPSARFP